MILFILENLISLNPSFPRVLSIRISLIYNKFIKQLQMILFHIRSKLKLAIVITQNIPPMKDAFIQKHKEVEFTLIKLIFFEKTKEFTCCKQNVSEFEIEDWFTALFDKALFRNELLQELLEIIIGFNLLHWLTEIHYFGH